MKFKNKEKYPLELWSSYKTVLFQSQAVLNKWGICCMFCIAGLLYCWFAVLLVCCGKGCMAGQVGSKETGGLFHSLVSQKSPLSWQPKTWDFGLLVWAGGHWLLVGISSRRAASSQDLAELFSDQEEIQERACCRDSRQNHLFRNLYVLWQL